MTLDFAVQYAVDRPDLPPQSDLRAWALAALTAPNDTHDGVSDVHPRYSSAEITVRIVDEAESAALNHSYRGKAGATNVLAFPLPLDASAGTPADPALANRLLGDLVLCAPVVVREALAQDKPLNAHWAHLVIHGVLHLLGYDHQEETHATRMEQREARILTTFGYPDPYGELASHD